MFCVRVFCSADCQIVEENIYCPSITNLVFVVELSISRVRLGDVRNVENKVT